MQAAGIDRVVGKARHRRLMRIPIRTIILVLLLSYGLSAENLEKTQKKELETQVTKITGEAQKLEKAGQLAEARIKYAESQALIEVKDVTDALKHLDEEIHKRVKEALGKSHKLYDARNFKDSATALDDALKFQAFEPTTNSGIDRRLLNICGKLKPEPSIQNKD
jgi:uncharacterized protein YoxC